jgi:hypothetical protein
MKFLKPMKTEKPSGLVFMAFASFYVSWLFGRARGTPRQYKPGT